MLDRFATGTPVLALRRPVHVCPSCLGVTRQLDLHACPDCDIELLERVPISDRVACAVSGGMGGASSAAA
jgi:hypothetical protein